MLNITSIMALKVLLYAIGGRHLIILLKTWVRLPVLDIAYHAMETLETMSLVIVNGKTAFDSVSEAKRGERHHLAVLTDDQIIQVIKRVGAGDRQIDIARELNVSPQCINGIIKGRRRIQAPDG